MYDSDYMTRVMFMILVVMDEYMATIAMMMMAMVTMMMMAMVTMMMMAMVMMMMAASGYNEDSMQLRLRDRNSWIIGADVNISRREREEIGEVRRENMRLENVRLQLVAWRAPSSQETRDMGGYWTWEEVD